MVRSCRGVCLIAIISEKEESSEGNIDGDSYRNWSARKGNRGDDDELTGPKFSGIVVGRHDAVTRYKFYDGSEAVQGHVSHTAPVSIVSQTRNA